MTPALHAYVKIDWQYWALHQRLLPLAYFLYFKSKSLASLPGFNTRQISKNLKRLYRIQRGLEKETERLNLPISGNICLPIHQGYKIFNFRKGSVFKLFDRCLPKEAVASEIGHVCEAGALDFAPKVRDRRIEEGWFEEEFIQGVVGYEVPGSSSAAMTAFFDRNIAPILDALILFKKPVYTRLSQRISSCLAQIDDGRRLAVSGLDPEKIAQIEVGLENIVHRLQEAGDMTVALVFSHGDFSFKNIMRTKQGIRVIDWEGAGLRSILCDLYNWFFTELYYSRVSSNLVAEMADAVSTLEVRLAEKAPKIVRLLRNSESKYRFLYYLERMTMLLQRDLNNQLLDVIISSWEIFMAYEEKLDQDVIF